jgi:hypothetical protein
MPLLPSPLAASRRRVMVSLRGRWGLRTRRAALPWLHGTKLGRGAHPTGTGWRRRLFACWAYTSCKGSFLSRLIPCRELGGGEAVMVGGEERARLSTTFHHLCFLLPAPTSPLAPPYRRTVPYLPSHITHSIQFELIDPPHLLVGVTPHTSRPTAQCPTSFPGWNQGGTLTRLSWRRIAGLSSSGSGTIG